MSETEGLGEAGRKLVQLLAEAGQPEVPPRTIRRFERYLELLLLWNARTNLTAIRDEDGILRRHFVESIAAARALPGNPGSLLDFGSGAGLPGIPIALCREDISVTLAESQGKKAAFLREAVRVLGVSVRVHAGRAEDLSTSFDCVTLRAVDRMEAAMPVAASRVSPGGWLAPFTTVGEADRVRSLAGSGFEWGGAIALPGGDDRLLLLGRRVLERD
ncbi:MAG TPA: 16S rRNA (guanine(527)-N(7))-methyltransferase RsmG [Terracidiphilus sp.]|jgi:16S rRNA (guanine527-N7)-methyltransferase